MEIFFIFLQVLFISLLVFHSIPNIKTESKYPLKLIDSLTLKSIIIMNIFLLFSFLSINTIYLLVILIFSSIIFIINKRNHYNLRFNLKSLFIFAYIFVISIAMANQLEFSWDTKFFWYLKTINFYQNSNLINLDKIPATDYPHLGTYIWSFFWKYPFNTFEYLGRIFYIFIFVLSIFYFCEIFKTFDLYKIILSSFIIIISYSNELFSGNQEVLIFSLVLISSRLSYEILSKQTKYLTTNIFFLLLSFNCAMWIKNEGGFMLGFLLFLILILGNLTLNQKKILIIGSLFIVILRVLIFILLDTSFESFQFEKTFNIKFSEFLYANLKIILFYSFVYLTSLPLILLGLMFFIYNLYAFKVDQTQLFIATYTVLNILFIFSAFIFSMENVEWQVRVGLKRVMFETSGFYLLTIAYLFNKTQTK